MIIVREGINCITTGATKVGNIWLLSYKIVIFMTKTVICMINKYY